MKDNLNYTRLPVNAWTPNYWTSLAEYQANTLAENSVPFELSNRFWFYYHKLPLTSRQGWLRAEPEVLCGKLDPVPHCQWQTTGDIELLFHGHLVQAFSTPTDKKKNCLTADWVLSTEQSSGRRLGWSNSRTPESDSEQLQVETQISGVWTFRWAWGIFKKSYSFIIHLAQIFEYSYFVCIAFCACRPSSSSFNNRNFCSGKGLQNVLKKDSGFPWLR